MKMIEKRSDPQVLFLKKIRDGKDRSLVFCEGLKLVEELFQSSWEPSSIYCTPRLLESARKLKNSAANPALPLLTMSESVMEYCSDLTSPPGIIALARPPKRFSFPGKDAGDGLHLVMHNVQLPQNVGALMRTSEAAGVGNIYLTAQSADAWGPKTLRGSAGSAFRLPVYRLGSLVEILGHLRSQNVRCVAAAQDGCTDYTQANWRGGVALIMGSEGAGFSKEEMALFDETIKIPMQGKVESLNVGIAAAVCLFEAARQRKNGIKK